MESWFTVEQIDYNTFFVAPKIYKNPLTLDILVSQQINC